MNSRFILIILSLFPAVTWAHQFLPTEARLDLISSQEYNLTCNLDAVELIQRSLNIDGDSYELIENVRNLPVDQIDQALEIAKAEFLKEMQVSVDDSPQKLGRFILPSASYVKRVLSQPQYITEYRIAGVMSGRLSEGDQALRFQFPDAWGSVKLTVVRTQKMLVGEGEQSLPIGLTTSAIQAGIGEQILNYVHQGVLHIVPKGLDHILFVLALFLLSTQFKSLLWQVTVFTIAHSITLILAGFKIVNVPASIVEPLIALSIAFVALENIYHSQLRSWRIVTIFVFGLLHGLGFASVLLDLGLPQEQTVVSLLSFNIGVEVGQILVVTAAFLTVGWFNKKSWYRKIIVLPSSVIIAGVGLFWTVERIIS